MSIQVRKRELREQCQQRRVALTDRPERSKAICRRLVELPVFAEARSVLFYVSVRSEAGTLPALQSAFELGKQVVVPYCEGDRLRLVRIEGMHELEPGKYGIPEPPVVLRESPDRQVPPSEVDLVVVPGVAFDLAGNRLGHGAGYYDKLLAEVNPAATLVGLAFDCQVVDELPTEPHDVRMDLVVTESRVIARRQ